MHADWHINRNYTMADMDRITAMVEKGYRSDDLAWELDLPESQVLALLHRNGLQVHPRRKRK